jgi:cell wall-associated NlpC family hydrolase
MPVDSACDILDIDGQWAHISSGEVEGYVLAEYLLTGDEALNKAKTLAHTVAKVKESGLRVRKEPSTDSGILMTVAEGEQLEVLENQGEWIKVTMDDEVGYAYAEYVEVVDEIRDAMTLTEARYGEGVSDVRVAIIDNAIQYVGCPYVWGGTSLAHGCDCSGFTMGIMAQYGVYLPHSSRAQANCGTRVSTSELKPGDLLFYGSGNYISHVAIYMGGGQIVHASDSRTGIIISNAFYRTPICATRVIYD